MCQWFGCGRNVAVEVVPTSGSRFGLCRFHFYLLRKAMDCGDEDVLKNLPGIRRIGMLW